MKKRITAFLTVSALALISGCASSANPVAPTASGNFLNEYPTRDRVDYVLNCVAKHGGLNYVNQYACGCKMDKIAENLSFKEYEEAVTFGFMGKTAGENGAAFRDPEDAKRLKKRMKEVEELAENSCFIK